MKNLKIVLFVVIFACLSIFVYLPKASAASVRPPIGISILSKMPGYRIVRDYGAYFTDSHIYFKNIINSIESQSRLGANACINLRIISIGHTERNYTQYATFIGYCEYVKLAPKK